MIKIYISITTRQKVRRVRYCIGVGGPFDSLVIVELCGGFRYSYLGPILCWKDRLRVPSIQQFPTPFCHLRGFEQDETEKEITGLIRIPIPLPLLTCFQDAEG
jgi:hypothetical protein